MESSRCAPNTYGKATNRMVLHTGGDKKQAVYNLLSHPVAVRKPTETRQTEKVLHIGGVEKKAEHIPGTTESPHVVLTPTEKRDRRKSAARWQQCRAQADT